MTKNQKRALMVVAAVLVAGACVAQFGGGGFRGGGGYGGGGYGGGGFGGGRGGGRDQMGPIVRTEGGDLVNEDTVKTARETASHSTGTPTWTNAPGFEKDVWTFTRIIYKYMPGRRSSGFGWVNDYPDSDLNLSWRVQQLTSLRTDPDGRTLKLTDPELFRYPWIYMVKCGHVQLPDDQVPILRKYLLNGGFLWADDFWGDVDWDSFAGEMKKVFPDKTWSELPMSHEIFHCVFPIITQDKNKLQVPSINFWERSGQTHRGGADTVDMHVRALFDDKGRMIVIATHNTDNGDGFEREGEDHDYFQIFSEQRAYPIGINIIYYAMTH